MYSHSWQVWARFGVKLALLVWQVVCQPGYLAQVWQWWHFLRCRKWPSCSLVYMAQIYECQNWLSCGFGLCGLNLPLTKNWPILILTQSAAAVHSWNHWDTFGWGWTAYKRIGGDGAIMQLESKTKKLKMGEVILQIHKSINITSQVFFGFWPLIWINLLGRVGLGHNANGPGPGWVGLDILGPNRTLLHSPMYGLS